MPFPRQWIPVEPYRVSDWDLRARVDDRRYWVNNFRETGQLLDATRDSYPDRTPGQLDAFIGDYLAALDETALLARFPDDLTMFSLDRVRRAVQVRHGIDDPYLAVKREGNARALAELPAVCAELDALDEAARCEALLRGLMAGNLFDVGSAFAMSEYRRAAGAFGAARERVAPRPWWRDDAARFVANCRAGRYRQVGWFVDNAGGDICLGVVPLVRWLLRGGVRVLLLANEGPALNDITFSELPELLDRIAAFDPVIRAGRGEGRLQIDSNGNDCPLMDLGGLPERTVAALAEADLLIFHGMGRGIESNWSQRFTCDVLRTAVVKDPVVAGWVGATLFDCLFRLEPGAG